jgi:hypothetical protein
VFENFGGNVNFIIFGRLSSFFVLFFFWFFVGGNVVRSPLAPRQYFWMALEQATGSGPG